MVKKSKVEVENAKDEKAETEHALAYPTHEELEKLLNEAEAKAQENYDKYVRSEAERDNERRRAERDVSNAHKFALEKFAGELLEVIDCLERGMQIDTAGEGKEDDILKGMQMTYDLFLKTLAKFKVVQINPLGEDFNPEWHEAISMAESKDAKSNTVIQVMQKGYLLNGRLIRPAMVVVAQ